VNPILSRSKAPGFRPVQVYDWQDEFSGGFYRRTHPVFDGRPPPTIEVRALTLDDFCRERGVRNVNFLKRDVEGAELEILSRMPENMSVRGSRERHPPGSRSPLPYTKMRPPI
jgi:FkbM family methyltransferase